MLVKMIDGKTIVMSDNEERQQRAHWDLNDKYPEYSRHCAWDGVNEPFHNVDECKKNHFLYLDRCLQLALKDVNDAIEKAQEEGQDMSSLYQKRKSLKALANQDLSQCQNVEDLRKSIPIQLEQYWDKAVMKNSRN